MNSVLNSVAKKTFTKHAAELEPADPQYETYITNKGRTKSRKRAIPAGLSKKDERILRSVRRRAHILDKGFSICGLRFGWAAILGIIPGFGDIAAFLLSYYLVLRKCREADLPLVLEQRMVFNQAVSVGAGMIPLVGDVILAVWKTNSRNAALLEEFLIARAAQAAARAAGGPATAAHLDTAAAESALQAPGIDSATGERVGGSAYQISEEVLAEEAEPLADGKGKGKGKGRAWYGWGGKSDPATGSK